MRDLRGRAPVRPPDRGRRGRDVVPALARPGRGARGRPAVPALEYRRQAPRPGRSPQRLAVLPPRAARDRPPGVPGRERLRAGRGQPPWSPAGPARRAGRPGLRRHVGARERRRLRGAAEAQPPADRGDPGRAVRVPGTAVRPAGRPALAPGRGAARGRAGRHRQPGHRDVRAPPGPAAQPLRRARLQRRRPAHRPGPARADPAGLDGRQQDAVGRRGGRRARLPRPPDGRRRAARGPGAGRPPDHRRGGRAAAELPARPARRGRRSSRYRQVGNAVPPLLAQAIGTQLRAQLT